MRELEDLMTNQQKALAKAIWEAENYGGCTEKAKNVSQKLMDHTGLKQSASKIILQ